MAEELELVEGFEALDDEADAAEEPTPEVLAELAAVAEAEANAAVAMESELAAARLALAAERLALREAVGRYRAALLAGAPEVPAELVVGETLDAVDASFAAAREAMVRIRAEVAVEFGREEGFPVGAPAREDVGSGEGMSAAEKIAYGLQLQGRA